ncbi:MAG: lipopolysaccharide heptosyltransferase II [Verrucomicrobia bacterium]|jgi:heptosyltransferase-2|nr:lipopolysaccharide heptosyltransferase II [Verrucomicrobiota bacterium]
MESGAIQNHLPSSILHPRRILVRGVNWLGDAVMTTPALLRLRERFPKARVALLSPQKLHELWRQHPAVDEVIAIEAGEGLISVGRKLREKQFDLALVLPNSPRAALEVWLAKIPQRIGYARPWRNWFLTKAIPMRPGHTRMHKRSVAEIQKLAAGNSESRIQNPEFFSFAHQVHEYLHLAAALGANPEALAPGLSVTTEEITAAKKKFGLDQITNPILGLNPGAEYGPAKRWPADRFIAAAREIQRCTNCAWLLLGGKAETALAGQITSAIGNRQSAIYNLAGQTSLRELMALLKSCRVLLTNDTGPMHVAAAVGTPVVVPFGSTSPELTGPGLPGDPRHRLLKSDAPCAPCFLRECPIDFRCMTGISVERVVEAVIGGLKG